MNRITHIGVEGAITVAINTDKQDLDLTRAMQEPLVGETHHQGTRCRGGPGDGKTSPRLAET